MISRKRWVWLSSLCSRPWRVAFTSLDPGRCWSQRHPSSVPLQPNSCSAKRFAGRHTSPTCPPSSQGCCSHLSCRCPHRCGSVSYTHLRAHETRHDLVCRLLLEKKKQKKNNK